MNLKNFKMVSLILNVMFLGMIIYVRNYNISQADDRIAKLIPQKNVYLAMHQSYFKSNVFLAQLAIDIKASDGSLKNVTRLIKKVQLPDRQSEDAYLTMISKAVADPESDNPKDMLKARNISWVEKTKGAKGERYYSFDVAFNKDDKLVVMDIEPLFWK